MRHRFQLLHKLSDILQKFLKIVFDVKLHITRPPYLRVMVIDQVQVDPVFPHGEKCITIAMVVKVTADTG